MDYETAAVKIQVILKFPIDTFLKLSLLNLQANFKGFKTRKELNRKMQNVIKIKVNFIN